jgi:hypothetical protein
MRLFKVLAAMPTAKVAAHRSVVQREVRATQRFLSRTKLHAATRHLILPISSLHAARTVVTLGRDATKTIVETRDREAADTQAESAEVMMNHLGEARHRLWRAPEILHAEMKGEAGMSETAGMEGVIDDLEERKSTLAVHCLMSKTHLPVGQCRVSHHLHRHRTVRLPHKNGSVVLRAATTKDSTADVVAEVAAVNSEAVDVKTSAMQQVVDLAAKTTSCSSQAWTVGSAGMRMLPGQGRRAVSTRKGDGAGDRMTW